MYPRSLPFRFLSLFLIVKMLLFGLITLLLVQNGARALEGEGIIGGEKVDPRELSYQVSIQVLGLHVCGGAIIDESHVITAAHCVIDDEDNDFMSLPLTVVAGTIDINDVEGHEYEVEKAYIPKEFDITDIPTIYDIAVLKLRTKLDLSDSSLSALSLPPSSVGRGASHVSYAGEEALISGFGWNHVEVKDVPIPEDERTEDGDEFYKMEDGDSNGYLLKAKTLIVTNRECQKHYRHLIYKNQLCAKVIQYDENVHQGVCSGDSGGPLVHDGKTLIGVVSYSPIGCVDSIHPAVYTRVSYFIDFINKARKNIVTETIRSHTW